MIAVNPANVACLLCQTDLRKSGFFALSRFINIGRHPRFGCSVVDRSIHCRTPLFRHWLSLAPYLNNLRIRDMGSNLPTSGYVREKCNSSPFVLTISILPLVFLLPTPIFSRERGPRVEVTCPSPPIPVQIDKNTVLVYELHITNFDTVPLTVKHIEIFANREGSEPIITFENEKLSAAMIRVGAEMMTSSGSATQDTRTIDPGARNVLFVWIELPATMAVPANLRIG